MAARKTNGDPAAKLAAVRQVVAERQYARVDGYMLDGFTASAIATVYDALNDSNREKFLALPWPKMSAVAFKLCK